MGHAIVELPEGNGRKDNPTAHRGKMTNGRFVNKKHLPETARPLVPMSR
jgi:hypothetical protein